MMKNIKSILNSAVQDFQQGNYDASKEKLQLILKFESKNIYALELLGVIFVSLGDFQLALDCFDEIVKIKPNYADAWLNKGNVFSEFKQYEKALASYNNAIAIRPYFAEAWSSRGYALSELNQHEQALISIDNAIKIKSDYAEAWINRGNILLQLKQYNQALMSFNQALKIQPDNSEAWSSRGVLLSAMYKYEEALASYDHALSICSNNADAWFNRGNTLTSIGDFSLAETSYREAIRLDPDISEAHSSILFNFNYLNSKNPHEVLNEAKEYGLKISKSANPKFNKWNTSGVADGFKGLRIGFVSGDLRSHPVGYFLEGLVESLDLSQFQLHAFPTAFLADDLTNRIKPLFKSWRPIYGKSDQAAAQLIHETGIHILIDLSGHTAHNRLAVFSYKPAPLQISWLGYFATTGIPEIDYILGDPHVIPDNEESHFTEKVWKLPEVWFCLRPPNQLPAASPLPALNNGFITFGSFGNLLKMNEQVVAAWSLILSRLPESKLMLKSRQLNDEKKINETRLRFLKFGIDGNRLILEGSSSREGYFEAYKRLDITLDTFPYPGGTTSVDSLLMGVPVLTLKGNRFLSHLGETIAINSGNSDWIASDIDDYVKMAINFATDLQHLVQLRRCFRNNIMKQPLFDVRRFAANFGNALYDIWEQCYRDTEPKH